MSAIGTKRTYASAPHMSALGGKADMPSRGRPSNSIMLLFPQSFEPFPCYTRIKYRVPRIAVS